VTQHLHAEIVPGCYRCELGRDEVKFIENCEHEWTERGGFGDEWRECWLCGLVEDA
jgi:hypothetical protein